MNELLTEIMPVLLQFAGTLLLALLGLATRAGVAYLRERGAYESVAKYDYLAKLAVEAVEQMYKNEKGEFVNRAKKTDAVVMIENYLKDTTGQTLTTETLDLFVERAVSRMKKEVDSVGL